jgi:MoxR-like ATPase
MKLARAWAVLQRRDFVTPDDVKAMAPPALAHRVVLRPELWVARVSAVQVIGEILNRVPAPATEVA